MMSLINYRLRVTLDDGRQLTGQMLAFDPHMNLILADTEEFRRLKRKGGAKKRKASAAGLKEEEEDEDEEEEVKAPEPEQKRTLGLIILRGENVVSLSVDGPPPADKVPSGPGVSVLPPPKRTTIQSFAWGLRIIAP